MRLSTHSGGGFGRFAVLGVVFQHEQSGTLNVDIDEADEPELLLLLGPDLPLTPGEWFLGW